MTLITTFYKIFKVDITKQDYELIQKYLDKVLTPSESSTFQQRTRIPAVRKELIFQSQMLDRLAKNDESSVRAFLNDGEKTSLSFRSVFIGMILIICLVASIFFLVKQTQKPNLQIAALADNHFQIYPASVVQRGGDTYIELNQAMLAYANKEYTLAQSLFQSLSSNKPELHLYTANISMTQKKYDAALAELQLVANTEDKIMLQNMQWYKSLCLLQLGRVAEAQETLNAIKDTEDHLFGGRAELLLGDLGDDF